MLYLPLHWRQSHHEVVELLARALRRQQSQVPAEVTQRVGTPFRLQPLALLLYVQRSTCWVRALWRQWPCCRTSWCHDISSLNCLLTKPANVPADEGCEQRDRVDSRIYGTFQNLEQRTSVVMEIVDRVEQLKDSPPRMVDMSHILT